MIIRPLLASDIGASVDALCSAFHSDPLIGFLFGANWKDEPHAAAFFRILLGVRVRLRMPAYCAEDDSGIVGAVMGYDATRPEWAETDVREWQQLMRSLPGLEDRLEAYGQIAAGFEPAEPHAYLGVIGVCGGRKGAGVGSALLEKFCRAAASDGNSSGVYLETASEASLRFYLRNGFELRGVGTLGTSTSLWCVFKNTVR